ncbi:helix-turn-helix domain-containing protein [Ruminococcus sp. HUN007]|uniref:helix-turn-helix domain-containing protein n=1 Tax=Ruminococcus sp. HUN007 TaxID=1514668 RepID=UPI000678B7FD|nr:helix-turn-helix domain-containing protein [Ruminococcus sp. HUN007]
MTDMLTGQKIAELRIKAGLTQEQLADRLYVTRTMVSKWERDICQPDRNTILKMADIFSVSPDEIMSVEDAVINELFKLVSDTDSRDLLKDLNEFLSTLNSRDRSVFIRRYYYFEDISVIAENYGIKEGNVRTVLMRTRKKFRKHLEGMIR